jgi:glycosyltransferase involved in cell wall biosynthesis
MSPSHVLVIPLYFLTRAPIVLDAGWSLSEAERAREMTAESGIVKYFKLFLVDFFAYKFSTQIHIESQQQLKYISKSFHVDPKKLFVRFTGFNESRIITGQVNIPSLLIQNIVSDSRDMVLFRGKFNEESGLDILVETAREERFQSTLFAVVTNHNLEEYKLTPNTVVINEYLPDSDVFELFKSAKIIIGQLSSHPRLTRTIPHKAFEAAFFGKPYISSRTEPITALFGERNGVAYFNGGDQSDFSNTLFELIRKKNLEIMGVAMHDIYAKQLTSKHLKLQFLDKTGVLFP